MSNEHQEADEMARSGGLDDAALRDELSVFGLSDTEIDTYLALLARGEATTSTVADDADVTQRAVYNIAERLERRDLVRVKDHASPTTIRALPPEEAIGNLSSRLESITPSLEERFNATETEAPEIQIVKARETALKRLQTAIAAAESEALVAVPKHIYPEIESELRAAVERDVLVFLLIGEMTDREAEPERFEGVADVVRYWEASLPFLYAVDDESAMIGDRDVLTSTPADADAVTVSQRHLHGAVVGLFLSAYWPAGTELHVAEADLLPKTFDWFRTAVFQAALYDQLGLDICADVETDSGIELSGPVEEVRQAIVEPTTNDYTLEMSLHLETDDGVVSFGGPGAFMEDYEAKSVRLRPDEE